MAVGLRAHSTATTVETQREHDVYCFCYSFEIGPAFLPMSHSFDLQRSLDYQSGSSQGFWHPEHEAREHSQDLKHGLHGFFKRVLI